MKKFPPLDHGKIKTYSIRERFSKVQREDFGLPWKKNSKLADFLAGLPNILAAKDFNLAIERMARAVTGGRTIILAMGAHPIKVGLNPIINDLINRGIISLLAVNGAAMIHDTEAALVGATSEDVAKALPDGAFGMTRETAQIINRAAQKAMKDKAGLGVTLGSELINGDYEYKSDSVFAQAAKSGIPVTVHVALGTDTVHIHPECDGAALGEASLRDFRTFCSAVATLADGVFINLGSAVILPEVFLKAVSLARHLGHDLSGMTTLNMDFVRQYRPITNVVDRPTADNGRGFNFTGHHEIMFPLLAAALIEKLD